MVKEVNGIKELDLLVKNNNKVLIDVYATWCGPCKMLSPIIDKVSESEKDVLVLKTDIDENEDIATEFGIESIPTLLVFESGKLKKKSVGFISEAQVKELLK